MAEDSFRNLVLGSITAMLFVFAILSFYMTVGAGYGKDINSLTTESYDFSAINESLGETATEAKELKRVASSGSGNGAFSLVEGFFDGVGAFFGIAFSMLGFIWNLFDLIIVGTLDLLFSNEIITGTVVALLILAGLFGLFRFLKQGS